MKSRSHSSRRIRDRAWGVFSNCPARTLARAGTLAAVMAAGVAPAWSQSVDLIQREVDGASEGLFSLGPIRLTPGITLGAGYDSNAYSSSVLPQEDVRFEVAPFVRAALPLGGHGLIDFREQLSFVSYREQTDLRTMNDDTTIGGAVGIRRMVLRAESRLANDIGRPTTEFDVPVAQKGKHFTGSITTALGWRHELTGRYMRSSFELEENELASERLNRVQEQFDIELLRRLTAKTSWLMKGFVDRLDFQSDIQPRDADGYGLWAGFSFDQPGSRDSFLRRMGSGQISGGLLLGFKSLVPRAGELPGYTGFISDINVSLGVRESDRIVLRFLRDVVPSVLEQNWYFLENRVETSINFYVTDRLFFAPTLAFRRSDYPLPITLEDADGAPKSAAVEDQAYVYGISINYHITPSWVVSLSSDYLDRQSNIPGFYKERLLVGFGMSLIP